MGIVMKHVDTHCEHVAMLSLGGSKKDSVGFIIVLCVSGDVMVLVCQCYRTANWIFRISWWSESIVWCISGMPALVLMGTIVNGHCFFTQNNPRLVMFEQPLYTNILNVCEKKVVS